MHAMLLSLFTGLGFAHVVNDMATQVKNMSEADAEEELLEAFKVLDAEGFGYVNSAELRNVLTTLGEKLSDEDLDEMVKEGKSLDLYVGFSTE